MRISDWSSDLCSSDLRSSVQHELAGDATELVEVTHPVRHVERLCLVDALEAQVEGELGRVVVSEAVGPERLLGRDREPGGELVVERLGAVRDREVPERAVVGQRSEEHTSELQSLMRIS